jgi:hypothetical protein
MMKCERAGAKRPVVQRHSAVGNPDAFPIHIYLASRGRTGGFFRTRTWKERAVEHGQFRFAGRIRNHGGEEARILAIHVAEIDVAAGCESRESQTLPMKEIFRNSQGNPGATRRPCRVGHQISL